MFEMLVYIIGWEHSSSILVSKKDSHLRARHLQQVRHLLQASHLLQVGHLLRVRHLVQAQARARHLVQARARARHLLRAQKVWSPSQVQARQAWSPSLELVLVRVRTK